MGSGAGEPEAALGSETGAGSRRGVVLYPRGRSGAADPLGGGSAAESMIPQPGEYLSFLMGAPGLSERELEAAGVKVLHRFAPDLLGLLVDSTCLSAYKELVRERPRPGFWNDLVAQERVLFLFKLADGTVKEFTLSEDNCAEISRLCSRLNGDPLEQTSDLPAYLAANPFYREVMVACYGARPGGSAA